MRLLPSFILLICLLFSFASFAKSGPIATVVKMRGKVTKLLPGALEATVVEDGDKLLEDTSIVTGPKSFIKIKFVDNSELNMGPESKIVISEMSTTSVGIISLLKGRIRTEVQKSEKPTDQEKNKFYIRTRTAALGVRGTDFQTIYNPDNRMTSLLTYKGAVAMAKVDESTHQRLEESSTTVVRDEQSKNLEIKKIPGKVIDEKSDLIKILNAKDTVIVPPGQNAFSSDALKKSSLPVKISPAQLNALYKNREFDEKNELNLKSALTETNVKPVIVAAAQVAPLEGLYNPKSGDFAPRAGGFIDQNTGLYIAPDVGSKLDEKNGVYVSDKSGDVDADTGQYVAPKGLVLDAKKGFVVDKNADVKPELLALREDLNKSIARDVVVGDLDGEVLLAAKNLREKFIRHRLSLSLMTGSEKLRLNENAGRPYYELESTSATKFNLDWQFASTSRFAPTLGVSYARVGYDSLETRGFTQDSKSLFSIASGLKYALTNRVDLFSKLVLDQGHYASQTTSFPEAYQFKRIVITKFQLGGSFELVRSNQFSLMGEVLGSVGFRKRFNTLVVSDVTGLGIKLAPQYIIDDKKSISLGLYIENENVKLSNNNGVNEQKREEGGLELKFNINI